MKDQAQLLARYQQLRAASVRVTSALVKRLPKGAMQEGGEKLGILHRGTLVFDNEEEMSILADFCVHDTRLGGKTVVERFWEESPPPPGSDERLVAEGLLAARFSLFLVGVREAGVGVHLRDLLSDATHFVVDRAMSQTAPADMILAVRLFQADGMDMTTGAGLPVCVLPKAGREKMLQEVVTVLGGPLSRAGWSREERSEATATLLNALLQEGRSSAIQLLEPGREAPGPVGRGGKPTVGRYDPCPCGSGKKFKFCCGARK
jgi:hypothetical protein